MDASITVAALQQSLAGTAPPLLIDVRRTERFVESPYMLPGALRRDPERVAGAAARTPAGWNSRRRPRVRPRFRSGCRATSRTTTTCSRMAW